MAIFLNDLYHETKRKYRLSLISGGSGMSNIVNWVYVSEDISTGSFLNGGELIITTGVTSGEREDWLYAFVRELIRHGTSGLILNTGKYIFEDDITDEVVRLCRKYNFPLFTMPWETKIFDITHDYVGRIFEDARAEDNLTAAFRSILSGKALSELQDESIKESGFAGSRCNVFCVLNPQRGISQGSPIQDRPNHDEELREFLHKEFNGRSLRYHLLTYNRDCLVITESGDCEADALSCRQIAEKLAQRFDSEDIHAGLGTVVSDIDNLQTSCRRAKAAAMYAAHSGSTYCSYNELGFCKILLDADDKQLQNDYINEQLGRVIDYDRAHNSMLTETLRRYLEKSGSVQAISQAMYCHRNTINYRLRIIKDELEYDLGSSDVRFRLMAAYKMLELRNMDSSIIST